MDCLFHNYAGENGSDSHRKKTLQRFCNVSLDRFKELLTEPKLLCENFRYIRRELKQLRSKSYDAIIVRYSLNIFSAIITARLTNTPLVLEVNSPIYFERSKVLGEKYYTYLSGWLERSIVASADHVVTVSEELRQYFINKGIHPERITTVINGFETKSFYPRSKDESLMKRLGIPGDAFVIGFSGSFKKWHGAESALKILAKVKGNIAGKKAWLVLVGDGPDRPRLEEIASKQGLNTVVFCGSVSHERMPDYLSLFDIALAPYPLLDFFYFSPLKVFEYMAMGIPTVASRQGQLATIFEHDKTGMLVEPGDLETAATFILKLLSSAETRCVMGQTACEAAHSKFGWGHNAKAYLGIIINLVKEKFESENN